MPFIAEDTVYTSPAATLVLREGRYRLDKLGAAKLADDGIIDTVAIGRFCGGDSAVRFTPREFVCIVAELAGRGVSDAIIADRMGKHGKAGRDWIAKTRERNGIPAAPTTYEHDRDWTYIADSWKRNNNASLARLAAAGIVTAAA